MNETSTREPDPSTADAMLSPVEARVLGCLLEKQLATPEQYPLTLSSLAAACNQKSNRDPVLQLDTAVVEQTLGILRREKKLVVLVHEAGARVPKLLEGCPKPTDAASTATPTNFAGR